AQIRGLRFRRELRGYALVEHLAQQERAVAPLYRPRKRAHRARAQFVFDGQHSKSYEKRTGVDAPQNKTQPRNPLSHEAWLVHAPRARGKNRMAPGPAAH